MIAEARRAVAALLIGTMIPASSARAEAPVLPFGVTEIGGAAKDSPDVDLLPFLRMIEGASVVALGEPRHTSGGIYQAKARVIRHLVEKGGYRVVAFETPWHAAETTARFVAGDDDVEVGRALEGLFGVWRSEAVRDLLIWLRAYNESHPNDQVLFIGFDVQQPWDDLVVLRDFLDRSRPKDSGDILARLSACSGPRYASMKEFRERSGSASKIDADSLRKCEEAVGAVRATIGIGESRAGGGADPARAALALRGIEAWERVVFHVDENTPDAMLLKALEPRDRAMAEVFLALRAAQFPNAKAVIWAANYHIARGIAETAVLPSGPVSVHLERMGTLLSARLGAAYAPVALIGYDVRTSWKNIPDQPVPAHPSSLEAKLHELGRESLLLDLHEFSGAGAEVAIEAVPVPCYSLREDFRAIIYLDSSPAARMLNVDPASVRMVKTE